VGWSVALNPGPATTTGWVGLYAWRFGTEGNQIWNFHTPVNLSFVVTGLNNATEGVILPAGTTCDLSNLSPSQALQVTFDDITDPTKPTLAHTGPTGFPSDFEPKIPCTLNNATTLTLDGTGFSMYYTLGLYSLTVAPATLQAQFSGLPSLIQPGQTVQGKLTCSNTGSGQTPPKTGPDALNVTCDPVIASGGGTLNNVVCTPPSPVGTLHDGQSIVCTFDLTAPNTSTVNMQLTGTTTADGLFATTATRSPGGMTATIWLRSASNAAVPTLGQWMLALLALLLGALAFAMRRGA